MASHDRAEHRNKLQLDSDTTGQILVDQVLGLLTSEDRTTGGVSKKLSPDTSAHGGLAKGILPEIAVGHKK